MTPRSPRVAAIVAIPNYNSEFIIWEYQDPVTDDALMHSAGSPMTCLHNKNKIRTDISLGELTSIYDDRLLDV